MFADALNFLFLSFFDFIFGSHPVVLRGYSCLALRSYPSGARGVSEARSQAQASCMQGKCPICCTAGLVPNSQINVQAKGSLLTY